MKKIYAESVASNTAVDSYFIIESPSLRTGRSGKYIACSISDCTGKISCRIWGQYNSGSNQIEDAFRFILNNEGQVFRIAGKADKYNDELVININDGIEYLKNFADPKKVTASDYIYSPADIEENKKKLLSLCNSIANEGIRNLVLTAIKKSDGFFEKPAAKTKHHDYTGGLCEHTLEVAEISLKISESLAGLHLNRDVLLAGAVLHDIGKCMTFEKKGLYYSPNPSYSLLGHITPAMQMLSRYTAFADADTYQDILHIIQSHHGEYAETKPQTPEAWTVHFADNISATVHEISEDLKSAKAGELLWGKRTESFVYRSKTSGSMINNLEKGDNSKTKSQLTITDCLKDSPKR